MRFYLVESKEDQQKLIDFAGEDIAGLFLKNRKLYSAPYNDLGYWLKQTPEELKTYMSAFISDVDQDKMTKKFGYQLMLIYKENKSKLDSPYNDTKYWLNKNWKELVDILDPYIEKPSKDGYKELYDSGALKVYFIDDSSAMKYFGLGTKWCIAGNYPGDENNGHKYFWDYIDNKNLFRQGYNVIIDGLEKYCVLISKSQYNNKLFIVSAYDINDTEIADPKYPSNIILQLQLLLSKIYKDNISLHNSNGYLPAVLEINRDLGDEEYFYSVAGFVEKINIGKKIKCGNNVFNDSISGSLREIHLPQVDYTNANNISKEVLQAAYSTEESIALIKRLFQNNGEVQQKIKSDGINVISNITGEMLNQYF